MTSRALESVVLALVAEGKGILAADETVPTLTKRFDTLAVQSTDQRRCTYREMLFSAPGTAEFICGAQPLFEQGVALEGIRLKPNRVIAGKECTSRSSVEEVAATTLRGLRRGVPTAVPGIVFLSGGQHARLATAHLNAINQLPTQPWKVNFSYGRALQDPALERWQGRDENFAVGQRAFYHRARSNGAASVGMYMGEMEAGLPGDEDPPPRHSWRDD